MPVTILPASFTAEMARALYFGRKTQTRRPLFHPDGTPSKWGRISAGCALYVREPFAICHGSGVPLFKSDAPDLRLEWRAPRQMPRSLSRLTLLVHEARSQRLFDITPSDALAEGLWQSHGAYAPRPSFDCYRDPVVAFSTLWNEMFPEEPHRWRDNPMVRAVSFSVVPYSPDADITQRIVEEHAKTYGPPALIEDEDAVSV